LVCGAQVFAPSDTRPINSQESPTGEGVHRLSIKRKNGCCSTLPSGYQKRGLRRLPNASAKSFNEMNHEMGVIFTIKKVDFEIKWKKY
jgi:hypothetical protein